MELYKNDFRTKIIYNGIKKRYPYLYYQKCGEERYIVPKKYKILKNKKSIYNKCLFNKANRITWLDRLIKP